MNNIEIGTLSAAVELDLSGLAEGVKRATGFIDELGSRVELGLGQVESLHRQHLQRLRRDAGEAAKALREVYDHIFEMTHSEGEVQQRDIDRRYAERIAVNRSPEMERAAGEERSLVMGQVVEQATLSKTNASFADDLGLLRAKYQAARSDAMALGALQASLQESDRAAERDEMALAAAKFEAERHDLLAIRALNEALFEDRKRQNQEELTAATWEQEVAAHDRESQAALKATKVPLSQAQIALQGALGEMRIGIESILGGAFQKVFVGDTHHLFNDLLNSFIQLLSQMAAKAVAAGIANLIFGGSGGFLGGVFGAFGFDDATNDKKASRWGYDFASNFQDGISDFQNVHGRAARSATTSDTSGDIHVHLHIGSVHNHTEADMGQMAEQLAWHVQTGLQGRFA